MVLSTSRIASLLTWASFARFSKKISQTFFIKKGEHCLPPHLLAHLLRLGNDGPPGGLGEGAEEEVAGGTRQQLLHQCATLAPPGFLKLNIQSLKLKFQFSNFKFNLGTSSFSLTTSSMASWAKRTTKERRATLITIKDYSNFPKRINR